MITRYILPLLGAIGLIIGIIVTLTYGSPKPLEPKQLTTPPSAPFADTIAGTGLVEASSRNISIGSYVSGIVSNVNVKEGDRVAIGDPLFVIDESVAKTDVEQRTRDLAGAQASIANARAQLEDVQDQSRRAEALTPGKTISIEELQRRRFAVKRARAALDVATSQYDSGKATLDAARVNLARMTVPAPIAGRILKVRIRAGESVTAASVGDAPILMGEDEPLHLRVEIDENDVWRFHAGVKATASLRSNKDSSYPLTFVRVEPYVQPKKNLNGDMSQRVDTRILEVVYKIETSKDLPPLYIGQQMDVFISAKE